MTAFYSILNNGFRGFPDALGMIELPVITQNLGAPYLCRDGW